MSLSIEELQDKIKMVKQDMQTVRGTMGSEKKIEALSAYLDYLEDQLKHSKA